MVTNGHGSRQADVYLGRVYHVEGTAVRQECTQGVVVRGNAGRKVVFFQRNLKGVGGGENVKLKSTG